jgi:hypothetical protein
LITAVAHCETYWFEPKPNLRRQRFIAAANLLSIGFASSDRPLTPLLHVVDYALDVIDEKLPLRVEVRARLQACIRACAELPYARVHKVLMLSAWVKSWNSFACLFGS